MDAAAPRQSSPGSLSVADISGHNVGVRMGNPWIRPKHPLIIAHRGYSALAPENTMEAYRRAVEAGAEMIEADVNITADGFAVMIHDWHLGRTVELDAAVHDLTLAEVRKLDAGAWFGEAFAGTGIPTAQELLEFARDNRIMMCFEVKGADARRAVHIAELLLGLFKQHDAFAWSFMSSYWHEALSLARSRAPQLLLAPERLPDDAPPHIPSVIGQAKRLNAQVMQLRYDFIDEELVATLHTEGIGVWAWPTTSHEAIAQSLEAGVDGIMGDDTSLEVSLADKWSPKNPKAPWLNG